MKDGEEKNAPVAENRRFAGFLLCTDFDQTLGVNGAVSPENAAAIRRFTAAGGLFTVISGRHPSYVREHQCGFRINAPIAGCNGALLMDGESGGLLYRGGLGEEGQRVLASLRECLAWEDPPLRRIELHCADAVIDCPFDRPSPPGSPASFDELLAAASREHICTIVCASTDARGEALRDALRARYGDLCFAERSWAAGTELGRPGDDKGGAVRRLRHMTGAQTVVAVGDYENDVGMIRAADLGYAVENAVPELKTAAARHTVHFRRHALAALIRDLEENEKQ